MLFIDKVMTNDHHTHELKPFTEDSNKKISTNNESNKNNDFINNFDQQIDVQNINNDKLEEAKQNIQK